MIQRNNQNLRELEQRAGRATLGAAQQEGTHCVGILRARSGEEEEQTGARLAVHDGEAPEPLDAGGPHRAHVLAAARRSAQERQRGARCGGVVFVRDAINLEAKLRDENQRLR